MCLLLKSSDIHTQERDTVRKAYETPSIVLARQKVPQLLGINRRDEHHLAIELSTSFTLIFLNIFLLI